MTHTSDRAVSVNVSLLGNSALTQVCSVTDTFDRAASLNVSLLGDSILMLT